MFSLVQHQSRIQKSIRTTGSDVNFPISIESIGMFLEVLDQNHNLDFLLDSLKLQLGYEYNLNAVKEIQVTDSFLSLDESTRKCQHKETYKVKISLLSLRLTS